MDTKQKAPAGDADALAAGAAFKFASTDSKLIVADGTATAMAAAASSAWKVNFISISLLLRIGHRPMPR